MAPNKHLTINNLIGAGSTSICVFAIGTNETGGDQWHRMIFGQINTSWVAWGYDICAGYKFSSLFGIWVSNSSANVIHTSWVVQSQTVLKGSYNSSTFSSFINT